MKGIIVNVDIEKNISILEDENKKQYIFSLDECIGFDETPYEGNNVKFGVNDGEIFFVEFLKDKQKVDEYIPPSKIAKTINITKKNIQINLDIALDFSVDDCLDNYFDDVIIGIEKYEAEFEDDEFLDYLLLKRFLNTAYNDLKDIDSSFMDEYLVELRHDLSALEKIYLKFYKKNTVPDIAYETIFLDKQLAYQKNKKRIDGNISEIYLLKTSSKSLEIQIKSLQTFINNFKLDTKYLLPKETELKRLNRYYVDSIHKIGNLKDENIEIKNILENFELKYKNEFTQKYNEETEKYDQFIKEQLNGYAYEFDKIMWERAEKSSAIRSFFRKSNIEEEYSSKTFLKYFIKNLDSTKYSKEHKRLYDLLEYLDSKAKKRILILSEDIDESEKIKHIIRSLDKEFSVEKSDKPRGAYYRNDLKRLDIIFVNFLIKNPNIYDFIDIMEKRLKQAKSNAILCVTYNMFTKDNLVKLRRKGIKYLLITNLSDEILVQNIFEIINKNND